MSKFDKNPLLHITDAVKKEIRKKYNMDKPERLNEAINILKDWLVKQDYMLKKDYTNEYLEKVLILCEGSVENAKMRIDKLATMKTLMPKFFTMVNPSKDDMFTNNVKNEVIVTALPKMTNDFKRVTILKFTDKFSNPEHLTKSHQYAISKTEYLKRYDYVNGAIILYDIRDVNIVEMAPKVDIIEFQQFATIIRQGYGTKMRAIYLLTGSKAVDILMKIVKRVFSEKITSRIQILPTLESLHNVLPKEILPVEYGGVEKSIEILNNEWIEALSTPEQEQYMDMMRKASTDETLRSSCKFNQEYMGMPGSFRQLSVD